MNYLDNILYYNIYSIKNILLSIIILAILILFLLCYKILILFYIIFHRILYIGLLVMFMFFFIDRFLFFLICINNSRILILNLILYLYAFSNMIMVQFMINYIEMINLGNIIDNIYIVFLFILGLYYLDRYLYFIKYYIVIQVYNLLLIDMI